MKPKEFINQLEEKKITSAIGLAEKRTSGEIRVFVSRRAPEEALAAAQVEFKRLKMYDTKEHNGVLIYVAPKVKKFAVIGDSGVHEKCGEVFWTTVAGEMTEFFKRGEFTEGIIHAIEKAGEILGRHFPAEAKGINQLPDEVEHD